MTIVDELNKLDEVTERKIMPYGASKVTVLGNETYLELGDSSFKMTPGSMTSLADDLDIPVPYLKRIPGDLKEYTINYFLHKRNDAETAVLVNTETESVRAFMNPQFPYVSAAKVFNVFDRLLPDAEVANSLIDDLSVELVTFSPQFDTNVVDSPVRAGIRLLYSDSWSVYPRFDSYLCRIACFNSAIMPIVSRKFRVSKKSETDVLLQAEEFVNSSIENLVPMIEGFKRLDDEKIEKWVNVIKKICEENRLPKKLYQQIVAMANDPLFLTTVTNQTIETMHDLVNLLTYTATHHAELTEQNREHLFSIAGNIMLNQDTRCVSCGSLV